MPPSRLIGIVGRKRAGKDTIADILTRRSFFQKQAFADFLKQGCAAMFMLSPDQVYSERKDEKDERWNVTPRQILQVVGTDLIRNQLQKVLPDLNLGQDSTLWCRNMRLFLETCNPLQQVVIPDVRFQDEADMIRDMGGMLIRVERANQDKEDTHISEKEQIDIKVTHTFKNDDTIKDLEDRVVKWLEAWPTKSPRGISLKRMPKNVAELESGELVEKPTTPEESTKRKRKA